MQLLDRDDFYIHEFVTLCDRARLVLCKLVSVSVERTRSCFDDCMLQNLVDMTTTVKQEHWTMGCRGAREVGAVQEIRWKWALYCKG